MNVGLARALGITLAMVVIVSSCGCTGFNEKYPVRNPGRTGSASVPGFSVDYNSSLSVSFNPINYSVKAKQYSLPLQVDKVAYSSQSLQYSGASSGAFGKNGFTVSKPISGMEDFGKAYKAIADAKLPVFVTADAMLHLYHMFFDTTLMNIENEYLIGDSRLMVSQLIGSIRQVYDASSGQVKEWARKDLAYLYVAASLYEGKLLDSTPDFVRDEVSGELNLTAAHRGFAGSPVFGYPEDYSQYVPRGHYTRSAALMRYFNGTMWLGRMYFPISDTNLTSMGVILSDKLVNNPQASSAWKRIFEVTAFFVGIPDDLTPYEYYAAAVTACGNVNDYGVLLTGMGALKQELKKLRAPKITSTLVSEGTENADVTQGLRLMGQRFIPDSYAFTMLTSDKTAGRKMPKGLDIMAVLGSAEAEKLLEGEKTTYASSCQTASYDYNLQELKTEFNSSREWGKNLYWGWLYSLKPVTKNFASEPYPTFMQTSAWQREKLVSGLGSWSQLRHDTILYAKQSYTKTGSAPGPRPVEKECKWGYVEPIPELYLRLSDLTNGTKAGLQKIGALPQNTSNAMDLLVAMCLRFRDYSVKELAGTQLTDSEMANIRGVHSQMDAIADALKGDVSAAKDSEKTTMIADVHSDPDSGKCLEVGTGYISYIVAACVNGDDVIAHVGAVFSYYEFGHPMSDRLTDEKWRGMLSDGSAPAAPDWTASFH